MDNGDLTELERQQIEEQNQASRIRSSLGRISNDFATGFKQGMSADNPDTKAINEKLQKNGNFGMDKKNTKKNKDTGETENKSDSEKKNKDGESKDSTSSEEKDSEKKASDEETEESSDEKSEEKDDKKDDKKDDDKDSDDSDDGGKKKGIIGRKVSSAIGKIKRDLIIFGVALGLYLILIFFMVIASYFESTLDTLSSTFGIPETTIEEDGAERSGLLTEEEYLYDDNGEPLSSEQLVAKLNSENECKVTVWNTIGDKIFGGQKFKDRCALMREIERQTKDTDVDKNLVISTLFYGYDTLPKTGEYKNYVPSNYVESAEHYKTLDQILSDDNMGIDRKTITTIINNAKITRQEYYYDWNIKEKKDSSNKVTGKEGECVKKYLPSSSSYDLLKWKIFMRFGEEAASSYEKEVSVGKSYTSSSDECKGVYTESQLLEKVKNAPLSDGTDASDLSYSISSSVSAANEDLKTYNSSDITPLTKFANIESSKIDVFDSYKGIPLSYSNGFAYKNFPGYGKAFADSNVDRQEDPVNTPKEIEKTIQNIISKKIDMNAAIGIEDHDATDSSFVIGTTTGSVITGAYCNNYLTAKLSEIQVRLTDCHGNYLKTVPFDDYIIGVANAEVSNTNDDYVLSEMLAAISYALHRRNNYSKGTVITMKSGTCDQAYCSMKEGCHTQANPEICSGCTSFYIGGSKGKNPGLYAKYMALYEKAAAFLVVSNGKVHNCHYVSTIQNEWSRKAKLGMSFTQIIQETYQDEGAKVIRCSDSQTEVTPTTPTTPEQRVGGTATSEYPKVAPDLGKFYGYAYKDGDGTNITISDEWKKENLVKIKPNCSDSAFASMEFTVHKNAKSNFEKAFNKVCKIITEGITLSDGTKCKYTASNLHSGTTFIERKTTNGAIDPHSYGISQDWNYNVSYNVNGTSYSPYSSRSLEDYEKFVEALGGNEENCTNVNYILWKYAYKDAGFKWGGNFGRNGSSGTFDGKLFELAY